MSQGMRKTLATIAALAPLALAVAPLAHAEEQTRESYKAQVEPICQANREANERIMAGAKKRIDGNELKPAGKQFFRLSASLGGMIRKLAKVPPPATDSHRIERWLEIIELLKERVRLVGKYFVEGLKIKGNHEAVLAERAGISANNTTIVLHFHYCRFGRFGRG
jgi:hypothetical protein